MNSNYDRREHIKPVILGVEGKLANASELELFNTHNPLGFILFSRNIQDPDQVRKLVMQLKSTVFPRNDVLVLIDQEGGRVSRLNKPFWPDMQPAKYFGDMIKTETLNWTRRAVYNHFRVCSYELKRLGINVNCAPLIDLFFEDADEIIGDRAFSKDPFEVAELAKEVCKGLLMGNVFPVIKHIPGHGRANVDSHKDLPIVDTPLKDLEITDFFPFIELKDMPFAMTAHIKYTSIDDEEPATTSKKVIDVIRNKIGFKNLLMTDDLSMEALSGSPKERAKKSLQAGCDILLHCNGKFNEMTEILENTDYWKKEDRERFRNCWKHLRY